VLQPVGGMDRIVHALAAQLSGKVQVQAPVVDIRTGDDHVEVSYRHNDAVRTLQADYCLNSIPGPIATGIGNNFSAEFRSKLAARPRGTLGKIAFQMRERFWEKEGIFGGISWTGQDIGQIQYPSHGFHQRKGVVIGGYFLERGPAQRFHLMSAQQRVQAAVAQGAKLHPGYEGYVENGVSVAWYRMNHQLGCAARDTDDATLAILRQAEGRHYLIGDQVSAHAGWQEAAVLSAHDALNRLSEREAARG
jgi:monoamine oxidase